MRKSIKTVLAFLLAVSYICSTVASAATFPGETVLSGGEDFGFSEAKSTVSSDGGLVEKQESQEKKMAQEVDSPRELESTEEMELEKEPAFYAEKELSE